MAMNRYTEPDVDEYGNVLNNYEPDPYAFPSSPPPATSTPPSASAGITYTPAGYAAGGTPLYRGSDGKLYSQNTQNGQVTGYTEMDPGTQVYDTVDAAKAYAQGVGSYAPALSAGQAGGTGTVENPTGVGTNEGFAIDPALLAPWTERFQGPSSPPTFTPPGYTPPAPFSYQSFDYGQPFTAPTLEQAQQEPGYQFALDQGLKALQQSAAAKGVLRTGGTLKDLINYGQAAGQGNYQNVFNRNLGTYQTNFGNRLNAYQTNFQDALAAYGTNYGVGKDTYENLYRGAQDTFSSLANQNAADYARALTDYNNRFGAYQYNQSAPFTKQLSLAQLGAAASA